MSSRRLRGLGIVALAVAMFFALTVPSLGDTYVQKATNNDTWDPKTRHLVKGDKVRFKNVSNDDHNVRGYGGWDFRHTLPEGTAFRKQFNNLGTFKFRCNIHSELNGGVCEGMCGKVLVH